MELNILVDKIEHLIGFYFPAMFEIVLVLFHWSFLQPSIFSLQGGEPRFSLLGAKSCLIPVERLLGKTIVPKIAELLVSVTIHSEEQYV